MGREIRRVPAGWEHPKQEGWHDRRYQPMYDRDYETAAREWLANCAAWEDGTHPVVASDPTERDEYPHYWEYDGDPPHREYYRPAWTDEERTHYQVYETVSEGTPVSPVFATLDELRVWLIGRGYSPEAAAKFVDMKWAPSGVYTSDGFKEGIEACAEMGKPKEDPHE